MDPWEATIFSFGSIQVDQSTLNLAEAEGVSICSNNIIYSLLDEAKDVLGSEIILEDDFNAQTLLSLLNNFESSSREKIDNKASNMKLCMCVRFLGALNMLSHPLQTPTF